MIRITEELNFVSSSSIVIYCDDNSTISMMKILVLHGRTKYIELHDKFICRYHLISRTIEVNFCLTTDQLVDRFTKALNYISFMKF